MWPFLRKTQVPTPLKGFFKILIRRWEIGFSNIAQKKKIQMKNGSTQKLKRVKKKFFERQIKSCLYLYTGKKRKKGELSRKIYGYMLS